MRAPTLDGPARRLPPAQALGRLAVASAVYYAVAVLILHFVQRDLDPVDHFMSEYVLGPAGVLMTTTFFVWALGIASLAVALPRMLVLAKSGKVGLVLLWIGALGIAGAGLFATDPADSANPVTTAGVLHVLSGLLGLPALGLGLLLVSLGLRRDERWRSLAPLAVMLSIVVLIGFLSIMFIFAGGHGSGLAQRIVIAAALTWMVLVGYGMGARNARFLPRPAPASAEDAT